MSRRLRRSFIVRVVPVPEQTPATNLSRPVNQHRFFVHDLRTGEQREFEDWEDLRGYLERLWVRQLR